MKNVLKYDKKTFSIFVWFAHRTIVTTTIIALWYARCVIKSSNAQFSPTTTERVTPKTTTMYASIVRPICFLYAAANEQTNVFRQEFFRAIPKSAFYQRFLYLYLRFAIFAECEFDYIIVAIPVSLVPASSHIPSHIPRTYIYNYGTKTNKSICGRRPECVPFSFLLLLVLFSSPLFYYFLYYSFCRRSFVRFCM